MLSALIKTQNNISLLCVRLALGVVMFPHGAQKVLGWFGGPGFSQTLAIFRQEGFPAWAVVVLMVIEFVGSSLLVVGYLTRVWALGIGTTITICMFKNHLAHGFFMNWFGQQQGEGFEYHILVLGMACALLVGGGGSASVDRLLTPKREDRLSFVR